MKSQAIDYFPMNVDFFDDDKIALIEGEFGIKGAYVAIRLLCKIFSTSGYYYKWGDDECLLFTKKLGADFTASQVSQIVKGLVRRDFFDKTLFNSISILTSRGIQSRYFEAVRKRKNVDLRREILLVDPSKYGIVGIFRKNDDIFNENDGSFAQSTVEYSRVEDSNTFSSYSSSPCGSEEKGEKDAEEEQQKIIFEFFFRNYVAPKAEATKFLAFNNTGGRRWKKMDATERRAALDLWHQTPQAPARFSSDELSLWSRVYATLQEEHAPREILRDALDDGIQLSISGIYFFLTVPESLYLFIEKGNDGRVLTALKPLFRSYMDAHGASYLQYTPIKPQLQ